MARKKSSVAATDDRLTLVVSYYERAAESSRGARLLSERDRDFYDSNQATEAEIATLKARGQEATIRNRIKPKIDSLKGIEQQGRTDPRANPRTPMDDQAANACTDAIRFVCDDEDFSSKRTEVFENILIEGLGGAVVEVDAKQDIRIRYIPWDRIFADPHSRLRDFREAKYKGVVIWLDESDAKLMWPKRAEAVLEQSWSDYGDGGRTYDDKPLHQQWVDGKRKRVKVVEIYYREAGVWTYCVFTKAGFLVEPQPSSYLDEDGEPECPIELTSCHVDRENNRYGLVRQLVGPQIEVNHRAWKALHRMTQQQTIAERGAVADIQKWKKEQAKPNGFLEITPGMKAEIRDNQQLTAFEMSMLEEAKREIDSVGANAALQGKGEAESGKALQIRRQSGLVETGSAFDSLRQWQRAMYVQIWHRIKQYWTGEKWVRVTDDERTVRFVGLNIAGPDGQKQNDVSRMDVDIVLDDVPDVATAQQEEFVMLAEAYKSNPQTPENPMGVPFDILIENSNLRNKQKILDRLRGVSGGAPGQPPIAGPSAPQGPQLLGPDGQPLPPQGPPDPMQVMGQIMEQAVGQLQQIGQQIAQGVQQAGAEAVGAIQAAGQQAAQGVQMAGHEAVIATQNAAAQSVAQVTGNAAANGVAAMMGALTPQAPGVRQTVITLPSGRTATAMSGPVQ